MRKIWLFLGVTLLGAMLALGAVACGDDDDDDNGTSDTPTATEAADATEAPDGTPAVAASVEITSPLAGDTVSSPVTVEVSASGVEIAPAADAAEGAGHYHAFVDQEPVAVGETIPQDTEGIFHFATASVDLELEPGEHTVTVVLGNNVHERLDAEPAVVTFTVE